MRRFMNAGVVVGLVVGMVAATPTRADFISVGTTNGGSQPPFVGTTEGQRFMQSYLASAFGSGPLLITQIAFRSSSTSNQTVILPDLQVSLSTTKSSPTPSGMSTTFAANIGADATSVFGRGSATFNLTSDTTDLDEVITFKTPFLYNPSAGNLLLDLNVFQGLPRDSFFTTTVDPSLGNTSAISGSIGANVGSYSNFPLFTRFTVQPAGNATVPEPSSLALCGLAGMTALIAARVRRNRHTG